MSPYCPGRTLEACPSPDALAVREEIPPALRAGEPPDAIKTRIEARFGQAVVGLPQTPLGRALPILLLALGAGVLAFALRRLVR
jgi:cytochrome c-type biogenesis protein CcmH/NrfF